MTKNCCGSVTKLGCNIAADFLHFDGIQTAQNFRLEDCNVCLCCGAEFLGQGSWFSVSCFL